LVEGLVAPMSDTDWSAIISDFALKSRFFISLGVPRLKKALLVSAVLMLASVSFLSCGGSSSSGKPPSGLTERVLVSQNVSSPTASPGLAIIDGANDTLAHVSEIRAGSSPSQMAISPTKQTVLVFDSINGSSTVEVVNTHSESSSGSAQLAGPTTSMVIPVTTSIGYAAVASATLQGYPPGAIEVMNLSNGGITTMIGAPNAQTIVANQNGTQLLVFSNDSDSVSVVSPLLAVNPVDTGCNAPQTPACTVVAGFDRPVYGFFSGDGSTAYILNCGAECGGTAASVQTLNLGTTPPTLGPSVPVEGATFGLISGSTLYVAGTSPTNHACTGQSTAASVCGRLDIVDLGSMTVTGSVVIADGYHDHLDLSSNGQLFVGSHNCTEIGNVNNPRGEVRGCLSIFDTTKPGNTTALMPPDNGDVTGLQGFTSRNVEYVVEGGNLRIYETPNDVLQATQITITGKLIDVKAIDFF